MGEGLVELGCQWLQDNLFGRPVLGGTGKRAS